MHLFCISKEWSKLTLSDFKDFLYKDLLYKEKKVFICTLVRLFLLGRVRFTETDVL